MTHFAVIAPPFPSHIRAIEALAAELVRRGHSVTLVAQPDAATLIREPALGFHAVGEESHPAGTLAAIIARTANPSVPFGVLRTVHDVARLTTMLCEEAPGALRAIGAEAVIHDEMEAAGGMVAEALGLPWISVSNAMTSSRDPVVPPPFLDWDYDVSPAGLKRNRGGRRVADILMSEHRRAIRRGAESLGIAPRDGLSACRSPILRIAQMIDGLDFPAPGDQPRTVNVGPLRPPPSAIAPLDLDMDPARPFVFASFGTLQGRRPGLFRRVAAACRALDMQVLVAHCGALDGGEARSLGATWVRDFVDQRAAMARADLVVTHGGINTVLDALVEGVPMLAIPLAHDQPGTAARLARSGGGVMLKSRRASVEAITAAMRQLTEDAGFRTNAGRLAQECRAAGGVMRAVDLIENAIAVRAGQAA